MGCEGKQRLGVQPRALCVKFVGHVYEMCQILANQRTERVPFENLNKSCFEMECGLLVFMFHA